MKRNLILLFNLLIFCFLCSDALGQHGALKGFVYDKSNGEPVAYAVVQLEGTTYGCMTEKNGGYMLTRIPAGDYTLRGGSPCVSAGDWTVWGATRAEAKAFRDLSGAPRLVGPEVDAGCFEAQTSFTLFLVR